MAKGKKNKGVKVTKEQSAHLEAPGGGEVSAQALEEPKAKKQECGQLKEEMIYDVADFFKVFGDSTRLKMLFLLLSGELCVGEIAETLEMTQSAVSHQLRVLRQSNLVKFRKDGKTVFYSLDDDHVKSVLEQGISHIGHKKGY